MKKGLLVLLLAVAMVAPAFAAKGDMSINGKLGLGVDAVVTVTGGPMGDFGYSLKPDMPFMLGAEFFYGTSDMFSVGFGATYVFNSSADFMGTRMKGGTTNIYVAVKPEFKVESDIFSSVYLLGQFGLAMGRSEIDESGAPSIDVDSGIYLGAGIGTTVKDAFLVELLFSSSNGKLDIDGESLDIRYSMVSINVGYKFAL
ncbi:outer membrane beta-barrel protein [Candidatus Ruminimicrobiellum ovillum]|uniref:outer membrane beta-barrel protein n=1 Tax=Candidatus Ruminimicrobiellum ovillum TaxID=1947927 RepID=UPI00355AB204